MSKNKRTNDEEQTDGGYGWVVVASAFFIGFITDGLNYSFGILLVELLDHFNRGRAETSTIVSVMTGFMYLVGPLVGALCDRYGCRVVVVAGAIISCAGFLISSFATSVLYLCLTYGALGGLGFGLMHMPAGVCVIQHFNRRRTLANGIAVCGSGVGMFVFNQLSRWLIDFYGWRGTLIIQSGITLQGAVLGLFLLPPSRKIRSAVHEPLCEEPITAAKISEIESSKFEKSVCNKAESENDMKKAIETVPHLYSKTRLSADHDFFKDSQKCNEDTGLKSNTCTDIEELEKMEFEIEVGECINEGKKMKIPYRLDCSRKARNILETIFNFDLLKDFRCWIFFASTFTFQLAFTIPFNLIPDQAIEYGMTKQQAAWLTSSIGISNTVGRVCIGIIGDLKWVNRLVMLLTVLILVGISTGLSIFLTSYELKMIYTCLFGFLIGGYITLVAVVLADLFGAHIIAKSFGLLMFFIGISGFVSTPIGGFLYDMTGKYDVTFIAAGAEFIIAGLLLLLLKIFSNKQIKTCL